MIHQAKPVYLVSYEVAARNHIFFGQFVAVVHNRDAAIRDVTTALYKQYHTGKMFVTVRPAVEADLINLGVTLDLGLQYATTD